MRENIYLVDGSAYLYRAFHAIRSLSTSTGVPTNATFGFTRILLKLIKEKQPEHVAVFFDVKGPTFRNAMFDAYKANRPPMPEELSVQIPHIKEIVKALNIPIVEKTGFEADDLIGTYARLAEEQGFDVVMVTGDKDFMQLVTDHSVIWDPMKEEIIDSQSIFDTLGLTPVQVVDMLGLAGDTADNIPGVPGVGPKTAQRLIAEHGSIQGIYDNIETLKSKKSLYAKLLDNRDQAFLSRDLVAIDREVEVEIPLEEFIISPFDHERLAEIFKELEFTKLYQEFKPKKAPAEKEYILVTEIDRIKELVKDLERADILSVDTETTSQYPMLAKLVGVSFAMDDHRAFYIPLGHTGMDAGNQPDFKQAIEILSPLLENPAVKKVGQNIKYDYIVLKNHGIRMQGIEFDTMIASHLLNPSHRGHGLDKIAMELLDHKTTPYKEITGRGKTQIGFNEVEINEALKYAAEDADITLLCYKILRQRLEENKLMKLMNRVEIPLVTVLADMEIHGVKVDEEKLLELSKTFDRELMTLEDEIHLLAGETFNINSSQQLGTILFEKLGLPVKKKTKKKTGYSTDVEVLNQLAELHDLPAKVLRYRSLGKLKSTYSDALQELINPDTGRIHTSFNQAITATGRLSSSDPNLQNIPIRTEEGKMIREAFIPEQGHILVAADYSQIELRLLAHFADDKILIEAFNNNEDIHTRTAAEVFQAFPEMITEDLRRQAKAINFGIMYGMSAFKLAKEIDVTRKTAQTYIDSYFARYAGVKRYIDATIEQAKKTGEVTTILGRKRRLGDINASNQNLRKLAERAAINTPVQGSAADLIKLAMINMDKALNEAKLKSKMILSVHDEIIFEVPLGEKDVLTDLARQVMEGVFKLKVPLKVNIETGKNWAVAH
ncbi:MAG: DNA polymerase I [Desulfobacterium sp.]|jgi:DNA polymerase-1|nr:DNA polymerase I [Desulfobacterium sp.]